MQDLAPSPQALDVLEARVAAVEARVFGPRGPAAAVAAGVVPSAKAAAAAAGPLAVTAAAASAGGDAPPGGSPQARAAPHAHATATEALASAHALLQAATSGREKAAAVLHRRLLELDAYLSLATASGLAGAATPAAAAAAARWPLVRREEPALREAADRLRRLAELRGALDPRPLAAAAELRPRLAAAAARADAHREAALRVALQVAKLKEQQNAALEHVTLGLALLEAQVSRLEVAAMPRQPLD
ncbi:hypothetical protein R5R35_009181 [Gryllus longicercus]|uniref:Uncharacterized protein n=1 Tax=Gryllus longicercus TaxID=2509291 RepID=A0AAN9VUE1_9ORTH